MKKFLLITTLIFAGVLPLAAQTSSWTFQGKLTDTMVDANGPYDFTFKLYDSLANGAQIGTDFVVNDTNVANGIFTVQLDFGSAAFTNGAARFIEIHVRPGASTGAFTTLAPRQEIKSSPFAIKSQKASDADNLGSVPASGYIQTLGGTITGSLTVNGTINGNGSGITNINGANIAPQSVTSVQISPESLPNETTSKLLGSLRWDLLRPQSSFTVGTNPVGIAFDGANIWVANNGSNNVTKLRASDGANLGTFAVGAEPYNVAFDGANVWITNRGSNNVTKLRASDGVNLGNFAVAAFPEGIAFDGANIWVTSATSSVTKLRASDGANLGSFALLGATAIAFDGANIWVSSHFFDNVTKFRASDSANLGSFPVGSDPTGVSFDGSSIWVAGNGSNSVTRLRASDGMFLSNTTVLFPVSCAFDGANIWVGTIGGNITKLRASDGTILGTFPGGTTIRGIAFDGANIWVTNNSAGTVTRLFPAFPQP